MKKAAEKVDQLNLEVPEGTRIRWELACDRPVKALTVIKTNENAKDNEKPESFDARIDATGRKATFVLPATQGFKYTFLWTERDSGQDFQYDDVQHHVRVVRDGIPRVELTEPRGDGLVTAQKRFKMVAQASDDHGLAKAWLVYSLDGSKESRVDIREFNGDRSGDIEYKWALDKIIEKEELKPGAKVAIAVEVSDLNPNGERRRRSITRQFTVVDKETYRDWFNRQFAAETDRIRGVRESQQTSSKTVKQLKEQETDK